MKKIKVLIPNNINELLKYDQACCKKSMNKIQNIIISYYLKNKVYKTNKKIKFDSQIQFYLYDSLIDNYFKFLRKNNYSNESEFLRDIYYDYTSKTEEERMSILINEGENCDG